MRTVRNILATLNKISLKPAEIVKKRHEMLNIDIVFHFVSFDSRVEASLHRTNH